MPSPNRIEPTTSSRIPPSLERTQADVAAPPGGPELHVDIRRPQRSDAAAEAATRKSLRMWLWLLAALIAAPVLASYF